MRYIIILATCFLGLGMKAEAEPESECSICIARGTGTCGCYLGAQVCCDGYVAYGCVCR